MAGGPSLGPREIPSNTNCHLLLADLESVEVSWDNFADHATLIAKFREFTTSPRVPLWRKPSAIEWVHASSPPTAVAEKTSTTSWTEWYKQVWNELEQHQSEARREQSKPPLRDSQCGRASVLEVQWSEADITPLKRARSGDFQAGLGGGHQGHTWWVKQTRRLQHLARLTSQSTLNTNTRQHAADLWRAIVTAPGFPTNFCTWWNLKQKQIPLGPEVIGHGIPSPERIQGIFEEMALEVRQLETQLGKQRREGATKRRQANRNLVFKDIRDEAAAPVSTLIKQSKFKVTTVQAETNEVYVDRPEEVQPSRPVYIEGIAVAALWNGRAFRFTDEVRVLPGQSLVQEEFIGDLGGMFEQFKQEWTPGWNRHQERIPETWATLESFASRALPQIPGEFPQITLEMWKESLRKKKKHTATGPDGVSRQDLLSIPDEVSLRFIQLFQAMEEGEEWPAQMAVGLINSLEKCANAQDVSQYRPITILPVAYRNWASIKARQCLQHIGRIAPTGLLGNMPTKTTSQAWHQLQQMIEAAQMDDQELAGCTVDLVKCFNLLPRQPLKAIAIQIGIPKGLVMAWHSYLGQLERRFVVRGSTGPPIRSVTGFPEGCPLSVVAMGITNLVCHKWMELQQPSVSVLSYVDDWQALAESARMAINTYGEIEAFCKLLDIEIDGRKSFCWSTQAEGRKELKQGSKIKWHCRELGGHLNFTKCKTNYTVVERINRVQSCWGRLARSSAPQKQKRQAVRQGLWPRALHGSAIVNIGACHFDQLRTGMMRGLNVQTRGANPNVQWSLVDKPEHDPEFVVLWDSVIHYRRYGNVDVMHPVLNKLAMGQSRPTPGPSAVLLHRLHQVGWHWVADGLCLDQHQIPIDLYGCCNAEAKQRLSLAWQIRASHKVDHRHTFKGIQGADYALTGASMNTFTPQEQGLLRCALNGTKFTNDALVHMGKVPHAGCQFCGEADSQLHRHWYCREFEDCRSQVLQMIELSPITLPPSYYNHGWMPRSPEFWRFKEALLALPDRHAEFLLSPEQLETLPDEIHLFTDGSCIHPTQESERVATWGVSVSSSQDDQTFWTVANGGVPGWVQSVARGEIMATIAAVTFAIVHQKSFWLWVDNAEVVTRLREGATILISNPRLANGDLWQHLGHLLRRAGTLYKGVTKVDSHQPMAPTQHWTTTWAILGNQRADQAAEQARQSIPANLWKHWTKHVKHQRFLITLRDVTHRMLVDIGSRVVNLNQTQRSNEGEVGQRLIVLASDMQRSWDAFKGLTLDMVDAQFHCPISEQIFAWATTLEGEGQTRVVSWPQIYVDFLLACKRAGVERKSRKWREVQSMPPVQSFLSNSRALASFVQSVARSRDRPFAVVHRRPESHMLYFWAGCVSVDWRQERFEAVENYFRLFGAPPYRKIHQLQDLVVTF